jgi:hypothetical protein
MSYAKEGEMASRKLRRYPMMIVAPISVLALMMFATTVPASAAHLARSQSAQSAQGAAVLPQLSSADFSLISFPTVEWKTPLCLGIAANGQAGVWPCTYRDDQNWHLGKESGNGFYQLVNGYDKCLTDPNGSHTQGTRIIAEDCDTPLDYQYWGYASASPGADVYWFNKSNGDEIDVPEEEEEPGSPVDLGPYAGMLGCGLAMGSCAWVYREKDSTRSK